MWPFTCRPSEERFWRWYQANSDRLFHLEADQERVFRDLRAALRSVDKGLTFEFGAVREGSREFVVSADGMEEHFPAVRRLAAAAPALPRWVITPFRPPASLELIIEYRGISLGPDDVWFTAAPDRGRVGLTPFVKGLTDETLPMLGSAGYLLLDNALGEFSVVTRVGFIEWKPLPTDPAAMGLLPFPRIREPFDSTSH